MLTQLQNMLQLSQQLHQLLPELLSGRIDLQSEHPGYVLHRWRSPLPWNLQDLSYLVSAVFTCSESDCMLEMHIWIEPQLI